MFTIAVFSDSLGLLKVIFTCDIHSFQNVSVNKAIVTWTRMRLKTHQPPFFLNTILEDISPFCGATDTPVLDFWWYLLSVLKPEWVPLFIFSGGIPVICCLRFYLQCDTCWPLGGQHGSQVILFYVPASRHWWGSKLGLIILPLTVWDQADAVPTDLCCLGINYYMTIFIAKW